MAFYKVIFKLNVFDIQEIRMVTGCDSFGVNESGFFAIFCP